MNGGWEFGDAATAPLQYLVTGGPRADPATALTWALIWLSLAVVAIIAVAVVAAIWRRRLRVASAAAVMPERGSSGMIWIYAGIPLTVAALGVALLWTVQVMAKIDAPPTAPRVTLEVTGYQWWWQVYYPPAPGAPAITTANEIHIPAGQPVLVRLKGGDVIHSFWVPALSGKTDTIPGRVNLTWLQAARPGIYRGQCTEYCGMQHANMGFRVVAQSAADFAAWQEVQGRPAAGPQGLAVTGEAIFAGHCGSCHAVAGTGVHGETGPDLTHLMSRAKIAGELLDNNVNNLSGWIANPQALKPGSRMPKTYLSGPQLKAVVAYLQTLK